MTDGTEQLVERRDVTRAGIRRFADAIGATSPVHHDEDSATRAGFRDLLAPRAFILGLGLSVGKRVPRARLGKEGLPLDDVLTGRRVVAGGSAVEWFGDVVAGDEVEIRQRLLSVVTKQGSSGTLEFYEFERIYAVSGETVARESFTRIGR